MRLQENYQCAPAPQSPRSLEPVAVRRKVQFGCVRDEVVEMPPLQLRRPPPVQRAKRTRPPPLTPLASPRARASSTSCSLPRSLNPTVQVDPGSVAPGTTSELRWLPMKSVHECTDWVADAEQSLALKQRTRGFADEYARVQREAASAAVAAEVVLRQALASTRCLGVPNPTLCSVCCMLLTSLAPECGSLSRSASQAAATLLDCVFLHADHIAGMLREGQLRHDAVESASANTRGGNVECRQLKLRQEYRSQIQLHHHSVARARILFDRKAVGVRGVVDIDRFVQQTPSFEQCRRLQHLFEDFSKRSAAAMRSMASRIEIIAAAVVRWQRMVMSLAFHAWRIHVANFKFRIEALQTRQGTYQRRYLLRKHLAAWRVMVGFAVAVKQRLAAKSKLTALLRQSHDRSLHMGHVQEMMRDLQERAARAKEDLAESEQARVSGDQELVAAQTDAAGWQELAERLTRHVHGFAETVATASTDDEDGRQAAENVLLVWANAASAHRGVQARGFGGEWRGGAIVLGLLRDLTSIRAANRNTRQTAVEALPPEAARRAEQAARILGGLGVEVSPQLLLEGASDEIVVALYQIWHRFGHLPVSDIAHRKGGRGAMQKELLASVDAKLAKTLGSSGLLTDASRLPPASPPNRSRSERKPQRKASLAFGGGRDPRADAAAEADIRTASTDSWLSQRQTLHNYALNLMLRRCRSAPTEVLTTREISLAARAAGNFSSFSRRHLVPFPLSEAELPQSELDSLRLLLAKHFTDLSRVFSAYSTKAQMDISSYFRFLSDCRMLGGGFRKPQASRLFAKINYINRTSCAANVPTVSVDMEEREKKSVLWFTAVTGRGEDGGPQAQLASFNADEVANTDDKFVASEFTQLLVHLACGVWREKRSQLRKRITPAVEHLLIHSILPNAGAGRTSQLRLQIWSEPVQEVVAKHRRELQWLFRLYAAKDAALAKLRRAASNLNSSKLDPNTMSLDEWVMCLTDTATLNEASLNVSEATKVFQNAQLDADGNFDTMVPCEFEDAMCMVAMYRMPHVYVPLASRIGRFLSLHLIPAVLKMQQAVDPQLAGIVSQAAPGNGRGEGRRRQSQSRRGAREARPPSRTDSLASFGGLSRKSTGSFSRRSGRRESATSGLSGEVRQGVP